MEHNGYKILVVDDEQDILEFVSYNLRKESFQVFQANNGRKAIELVREIKPHVVILDVMMPEMDGIETCERIRAIPDMKNLMIAFLTARSEDYSQIAGFEAGGDDYIAKPIKPKVLVSRINALLRRGVVNPTEKIAEKDSQKVLGNLVIDYEKYLVQVDDVPLELPKKEFMLLRLLTSSPSRVFTREEIFDYIWGDDVFVGDRTIDVYIRKVREKIGEDRIKTIKGVGYKFDYR
jgi:two-component system alkaline phosphatase synthesis response regulator PhoP